MNKVWSLVAVMITAFVVCSLVYDARENAAIHARAQQSLSPRVNGRELPAPRIDPMWLDRELPKLQAETKLSR